MRRSKAALVTEIVIVIGMSLAVEWLAAVFTHTRRNFLPFAIFFGAYLLIRAILLWKGPTGFSSRSGG